MKKEKNKKQNYQAPKLMKIGSFKKMTLGKRDDTADEKLAK